MKFLNNTAQFKLVENVEFVLRDKNGRVKPLFQTNKLFTWLIKYGFVSPFAVQWLTAKKNRFADFCLSLMGHWAFSFRYQNLVTSAGKAGVASRINGAGSEAAFTYLAVGTGTTAAAAGNTALETEITDSGLSRANSTASRVTTTVTNDTAQLVNTFSVSGTKAVTEAGILNASSSGVLLARQVFSAINVISGDSLQLTYKVAVA